MDSKPGKIRLVTSACAAGVLWGGLEAILAWKGSGDWIASPGTLIGVSVVLAVSLCVVPGCLIGRWLGGGIAGFAGGALTLVGVEIALAIASDPPPFQAAPWWVNSPLAGILLLLGLAAALGFGRRWPRALAGFGAVAVLLLPSWGQSRDAPVAGSAPLGSPNLLLVTLDTTRADHMGVHGARDQTPAFDRVAREGLLAEKAISPIAVTGPAHTTLLSGLGPWSHQTLLNGVPVPQEVELLSQRLEAVGYRNGAFVSAYVLDGSLGFDRGFSTYDDDFSAVSGMSSLLPVRIWRAVGRRVNPHDLLERKAQDTVDAALSWLSVDSARPWFLWVHIFDAHGPYEAPPPYDELYYEGDPRDPAHKSMEEISGVAVYLEESLRGIRDVQWVLDQYGGEIAYADDQWGRLLEHLDESGEVGETLVAVVGDHGESFGEHGVWFDHGDDLYEEATWVPLAIRWPGHVEAGQRLAHPVEISDLLPTIYSLLKLPEVAALDGMDLRGPPRDVVRGICFDREANLAERERNPGAPPRWRMAAIRTGSVFYLHREAEGFEDQLVDLSDPERDLAGTPEGEALSAAYRVAARELLEAGSAGVERSGVELSPELRAGLEALGYVE
jgi:arylsulfatase A-like enzyme